MILDSELKECSSPAVLTEEGEWEKIFRPGPGFIGFSGHFPGKPVLPAIVQLRMLRILFEEAVGPIGLPDITSAKFLTPAVPDISLSVRIRRNAERWIARIEAIDGPAPSSVSEFRFKVPSHGQDTISPSKPLAD